MFQPEKALQTLFAKVENAIQLNQIKRQCLAPTVRNKTLQVLSGVSQQHLISAAKQSSAQSRCPNQPPCIFDNKTSFQLLRSQRKQLLFPQEIGQINQRIPFKHTASIAQDKPVQLDSFQKKQNAEQDDRLRKQKQEQRQYRLRSMSLRPAPTSSQLKDRKKRLKQLQAKAKQRIYYTYQYDGSIIKAQNYAGIINVPRLKSKMTDVQNPAQSKTVPIQNVLIQKAPSRKLQDQSRTFDFQAKDISTLEAFRPMQGSKFTESYGQQTKIKEQVREKSIKSCSLKEYKQQYKSIKLLSPQKQIANPIPLNQYRQPSAYQNSIQLSTIDSRIPKSLKSLLQFKVAKTKKNKGSKNRELRGMRKAEWQRIERRLQGDNRLSKYFYQKLQGELRKVSK